MAQTNRLRSSKWLWLTLAVVTGFGAAVGCLVYIANGVVVGDLWALPGRENYIAVALHQARIGLLSCVLLQFGVAGALFSYMDREDYLVARIVWSVVLSFALTCACFMVILFGAKAFR